MPEVKKCRTYVSFLKEVKKVYAESYIERRKFLCFFLEDVKLNNPKYEARLSNSLEKELKGYGSIVVWLDKKEGLDKVQELFLEQPGRIALVHYFLDYLISLEENK